MLNHDLFSGVSRRTGCFMFAVFDNLRNWYTALVAEAIIPFLNRKLVRRVSESSRIRQILSYVYLCICLLPSEVSLQLNSLLKKCTKKVS